MIILQYAKHGNLWSYLEQNFNKMTWKMKCEFLNDLAQGLHWIHRSGLVHRNLHGGNIAVDIKPRQILQFRDSSRPRPLLLDLGLARSEKYVSTSVKGVLPFVAPEVFSTGKFTKKSDTYAFGIIMHLLASGEPPFRNRQFDNGLVHDISNGLRPRMPYSAPTIYKYIAMLCCDADPDKRPDICSRFINKLQTDDPIWNTIYNNDVEPLSRFEKESKYSSKLLPIRGRE